MIDPRIRLKPSSVTLFQYENALREFLDCVGSVNLIEIKMQLHLNEPSELYEGRDFAIGKTSWVSAAGERDVFLERWVWDARAWYTRSTGFVVPATVDVTASFDHAVESVLTPPPRKQTRATKRM